MLLLFSPGRKPDRRRAGGFLNASIQNHPNGGLLLPVFLLTIIEKKKFLRAIRERSLSGRHSLKKRNILISFGILGATALLFAWPDAIKIPSTLAQISSPEILFASSRNKLASGTYDGSTTFSGSGDVVSESSRSHSSSANMRLFGRVSLAKQKNEDRRPHLRLQKAISSDKTP